jgi:hypothetical protein
MRRNRDSIMTRTDWERLRAFSALMALPGKRLAEQQRRPCPTCHTRQWRREGVRLECLNCGTTYHPLTNRFVTQKETA